VAKNIKKEEKEKVKTEPKKISIEKKEPEIDLSKYLFKTIKECNSMSKCYFYKSGHLILFCDERKISLCPIKNFFTDTPKIYSKNIEKDVIVDICLSPEKKLIFCANKNSKSILYYTLEKVEGKIKLVKLDKSIITNRPYEIKSIVSNSSGTLLCSIGTNDDTEIQIFDPISFEIKFKESTSAIQNLQMIMGPNDSDLLISTFMNDISVLNFEQSDKFNNETKKYENIYKFKRNSSIPLKAKPLFYALSNDEKFFVVSSDDKSIKIFRNYGNISESKIYTQINLEFNSNIVALFVDYFENGKLEGFVGVCRDNDIIIYKVNGQIYLELPEAHNGEILGMYLTRENKDDNDNKKNNDLVLISAGKDGKIKFWKI
jgi:WD40 repeat protein